MISPWTAQAINGMAALLLLISFALLSQKRLLAVLHWFSAQSVLLAAVSALVAFAADDPSLYISAALQLGLKGILLPWLLWRIIVRLGIHREVEMLVQPAWTIGIAVGVVLLSFHLVAPMQKTSTLITRDSMAIATACVMLGMLMMITRKKAITQVIGFLSLENALFFAAIGTTNGMPLVVELGVAFDVLVAALIFGVFFFQIRSTFDSMDIEAMEAHLHEEETP